MCASRAFCKFSLCQCALSSFNKLKSKNMVAFKNLTGTVKGAMMWHIHIQAYTYKHTHTTMQWCAPQVCDAFPWKGYKHIMRKCSHCTVLCSQFGPAVDNIVYESTASRHELIQTQSVDYTLLLLLYGLVIVMITSYVHCHTIIQIQSCNGAAR